MGITDELRHEVADYPFRDNRDFAIFEAVADRIDAEHERTVGFCKRLEDAAAKREDVEIFGVEYTALPLDADGEPIRVGDVMEFTYDPPQDQPIFEVSGFGANETLFYVPRGEVAPRKTTNASVVRHYRQDSWERIIEDAVNVHGNGFNPCWTDERDALVARCKKLAGGE